jgi:hypothetical protein
MKRCHGNEDELLVLLAALREAGTRDEAPADVETALMKHWDARASSFRSWGQVFASLAAAAVLVVSLVLLGQRLRTAGDVTSRDVTASSSTVVLVGEPLMEGEAIRLVRTRVPMSVLQDLGIRATADLPFVEVDLIVGDDGVARGLRVNDSLVGQ